VSRHGAMALSWTLDKIGPMCRTAEDCGYVLQAIAGADKEDPGSAGKSFYYAPQFVRPLNEIRVAYAPVDFEGWADPAARADFAKAVEVIKGLGVQLRESKTPDFPYGPTLSTILNSEAGSIFEELIVSGKVDQLDDARQIAGLKASRDVTAADYLKAMRIRGLMQKAFAEFFWEHDVILAPSRMAPATRIADPLDRSSSPPREMPKERGFSGIIGAANLVGVPALSLPCGFANGLPIAIQLVARPFNENLILGLGKAFQERTDWHTKHPQV
jgi:aspartyl-tRNA(Asn)/glutamyl-tRNA(Gln) amidotransferase subunit A